MATAIKGKKGFIKLKPTDKKTIRKSIFFTAKDYKKVEQMAKAKAMNVQEYFRYKILAE